jgi:hypothetical protein
MAYFGMQPLGSLLVGAISQYIGAPDTLLIEGLSAFGIVALFWSFLSKKDDPVHRATVAEASVAAGRH